jgi:hypothetical protein
MGDRPQEIINRLVIDSDILVAIFWSRLGSPTGLAASGTIEEIDKHRGAKKPTMIYFSTEPVPHDVDTKQFEDVRKLRQKYESEGLIGTFANSEEFRRVFAQDLAARMVQYLKSQPPRARSAFEPTILSPLQPILGPSQDTIAQGLKAKLMAEVAKSIPVAAPTLERASPEFVNETLTLNFAMYLDKGFDYLSKPPYYDGLKKAASRLGYPVKLVKGSTSSDL